MLIINAKSDYSMKYYVVILTVFWAMCACTSSISKQQKKAEAAFIEEVQYMSKKEALSNEVNYYKDPVITVCSHKRSLTGKDLIHECNRVIEEDNNAPYSQMGPTTFKIIRRVGDIKEYALNHPEEIIANEFYFEGTFTHYNHGYDTRKAIVIYVPEIDRTIIDQKY